MKKLFKLTLLSLLAISTNALAGELVNKKTGEKVSFSLGAAELKIDGSKAGLP